MELGTDLKEFFENGPLAQKAASSIKNGREIRLDLVQDDETATPFTFAREKGHNVFRQGAPGKPDLTFTIPEASARDLVRSQFESVGQVGLHIFQKMLSNDPKIKIRAKLQTGILSMVTGGYLGVLTAGGAEVAGFLAKNGLGSLSKLKETISKFKG